MRSRHQAHGTAPSNDASREGGFAGSSSRAGSGRAPEAGDARGYRDDGAGADADPGSANAGPPLDWNLEEVPIREGMGFGFSAGGLLFPYFVGNAAALRRLGLVREDTVFAGSSAGSLISSCMVCDLDPEALMDASLEMYRELRRSVQRGAGDAAEDAAGTADVGIGARLGGSLSRLGIVGSVGETVERYAHKILPADAHLRASGRLHVAVVRLNRQRPFAQPLYVNQFFSKDDLIAALMTSSHVPLYMNAKVTNTFRGRACVDGGLGEHFVPVPPCTEPVQVCCFPGMPFAVDIAPGNVTPCPYSLRQMLQFALLPPSDDKVVELYEMGVNDVLDWAKARSPSVRC